MLNDENGAGGGIRTHEPLQDRSLSPTPLTMLGDLRLIFNLNQLVADNRIMQILKGFTSPIPL